MRSPWRGQFRYRRTTGPLFGPHQVPEGTDTSVELSQRPDNDFRISVGTPMIWSLVPSLIR